MTSIDATNVNIANETQGKKEEVVYEQERFEYGLLRKSVFSQAAQNEIIALNLTEEEKLYIRHFKLKRLVEYLRNKRKHQVGFSYCAKKPSESFVLSKEDNDILNKFFQHYESCKDGGPCNVESCSEIKEILACFKKCKAEKKFDCILCGSDVEYDLWYWKEEDLYKNNQLMIFEKELKLIEDYMKLKERSNWHTADLFSPSPSNGGKHAEVLSDEEGEKKLKKFLLIRHSEICFFRSICSKVECNYSNCKVLREVLSHLYHTVNKPPSCPDRKTCSFVTCSEVREIMTHWEDCYKNKNVKCSLCGKYLSQVLTLEKEIEELEEQFENQMDEELKQLLERYSEKKINMTDKIQKFFSNC